MIMNRTPKVRCQPSPTNGLTTVTTNVFIQSGRKQLFELQHNPDVVDCEWRPDLTGFAHPQALNDLRMGGGHRAWSDPACCVSFLTFGVLTCQFGELGFPVDNPLVQLFREGTIADPEHAVLHLIKAGLALQEFQLHLLAPVKAPEALQAFRLRRHGQQIF